MTRADIEPRDRAHPWAEIFPSMGVSEIAYWATWIAKGVFLHEIRLPWVLTGKRTPRRPQTPPAHYNIKARTTTPMMTNAAARLSSIEKWIICSAYKKTFATNGIDLPREAVYRNFGPRRFLLVRKAIIRLCDSGVLRADWAGLTLTDEGRRVADRVFMAEPWRYLR